MPICSGYILTVREVTAHVSPSACYLRSSTSEGELFNLVMCRWLEYQDNQAGRGVAWWGYIYVSQHLCTSTRGCYIRSARTVMVFSVYSDHSPQDPVLLCCMIVSRVCCLVRSQTKLMHATATHRFFMHSFTTQLFPHFAPAAAPLGHWDVVHGSL